jgi:hypothetical protein
MAISHSQSAFVSTFLTLVCKLPPSASPYQYHRCKAPWKYIVNPLGTRLPKHSKPTHELHSTCLSPLLERKAFSLFREDMTRHENPAFSIRFHSTRLEWKRHGYKPQWSLECQSSYVGTRLATWYYIWRRAWLFLPNGGSGEDGRRWRWRWR